MGAMARQVLQVKRKNSTSCNCPAARLTVEGSVASRLGPREVATAGSAFGWVAVFTAVGGAVTTGEAAGVQAARKTASNTRLGRRRVFIIICIFREFVPENPYESMNRC